MTDCTTIQVVADRDGNGGNGGNGNGGGDGGDDQTLRRLSIAGIAFVVWRRLSRGGD